MPTKNAASPQTEPKPTILIMKPLEELLRQTEFSDEDIVRLLGITAPEDCLALKRAAYKKTTDVMGDRVFFRGLIEVSNICTANCRYCGIRKDNHDVKRYEMTEDEIVEQAVWAAENGYGSVCLQAGERRDAKFIDFITRCLKRIHAETVSEELPDGVGITLSLGDQEKTTFETWAQASGNRRNLRYLSRFESSNPDLFKLLHTAPGKNQKNLEHRFQCFQWLKECGYQLGTGVMIGIPGQTLEDLCRDIRLFQKLDVDMIGMGPYLKSEGGDLKELGQMDPKALMQLSLNMIAVVRLVLGDVNIAAATALQAIRDDGREIGIEYGANVVMPNLSPQRFRAGYQLYDNKPCLNDEPTQCGDCLEKRIASRGRRVGWNMMGSSRHYRTRTGQTAQEAIPESTAQRDALNEKALRGPQGQRRIFFNTVAV